MVAAGESAMEYIDGVGLIEYVPFEENADMEDLEAGRVETGISGIGAGW